MAATTLTPRDHHTTKAPPMGVVLQFPTRRGWHPRPIIREAPKPIFPLRQPVRIEWPDWMKIDGWHALYAAPYRPKDQPERCDPACIRISRAHWATIDNTARRLLVCHELAHHFLQGTLHGWGGSPLEQAYYQRSEAATDALGAHLARNPHLGQLLVTGGVLSPTDGAWLDRLAEVEDVLA